MRKRGLAGKWKETKEASKGRKIRRLKQETSKRKNWKQKIKGTKSHNGI